MSRKRVVLAVCTWGIGSNAYRRVDVRVSTSETECRGAAVDRGRDAGGGLFGRASGDEARRER